MKYLLDGYGWRMDVDEQRGGEKEGRILEWLTSRNQGPCVRSITENKGSLATQEKWPAADQMRSALHTLHVRNTASRNRMRMPQTVSSSFLGAQGPK